MRNGLNRENAIIIESTKDVQNEISMFIDDKHGSGDGDYFIHAQQEYVSSSTKQKYNVILVEYTEDDKVNRVQYWFEIV